MHSENALCAYSNSATTSYLTQAKDCFYQISQVQLNAFVLVPFLVPSCFFTPSLRDTPDTVEAKCNHSPSTCRQIVRRGVLIHELTPSQHSNRPYQSNLKALPYREIRSSRNFCPFLLPAATLMQSNSLCSLLVVRCRVHYSVTPQECEKATRIAVHFAFASFDSSNVFLFPIRPPRETCPTLLLRE